MRLGLVPPLVLGVGKGDGATALAAQRLPPRTCRQRHAKRTAPKGRGAGVCVWRGRRRGTAGDPCGTGDEEA